MFILSKKRFQFRNANNETFTTKGGMIMEKAPDWCADNIFFKLAAADGDIILAADSTEKAAVQAVAKEEAKAAAKTATAAEPAKAAAGTDTAKAAAK